MDNMLVAHSKNVCVYSLLIAEAFGLQAKECDTLCQAALYHDVGKMFIPPEILNKPSKLSEEEFEIMKTHCVLGEKLLFYKNLKEIALIVRSHHEKYNNGGYPDGLAGTQIPFLSRILCVADSYDAMTSERCYNKPKNQISAIKELEYNSGTQFDPEVVDVFVKVLKRKEQRN